MKTPPMPPPNPQPAAQTEHTPTPWRPHDMEADAIVGPDRKAIALVMGRSRTAEEDAANLAFICTAVNSHAQLVEALRAVDSLLSGDMNYEHAVLAGENPASSECKTPAKVVRAALASAARSSAEPSQLAKG